MLRIGTTGPKPVQKSLPARVFDALEKQVEAEGFAEYTHAQEWLLTKFGRKVPYSTVHKLIRYRLGAKLKRARPRHQKNLMAPCRTSSPLPTLGIACSGHPAERRLNSVGAPSLGSSATQSTERGML